MHGRASGDSWGLGRDSDVWPGGARAEARRLAVCKISAVNLRPFVSPPLSFVSVRWLAAVASLAFSAEAVAAADRDKKCLAGRVQRARAD